MGPIGDDAEFPRLVLIHRGGSTLHRRDCGLGDDEAADLGHSRHLEAERGRYRPRHQCVGARVVIGDLVRPARLEEAETGRAAALPLVISRTSVAS